MHTGRFFRILSALLFLAIPLVQSEEPLSFSSQDVIQRLELRRGNWVGLKADVELQFENAKSQTASCHGQLLYQRLDERIDLRCLNDQQKLVFVFKTSDREFELFLPGRKTFFKGNIFQLNDSPSIESHLRPLDLYRAFKPALLQAQNTLIKQIADGKLELLAQKNDVTVRKLEITNQGDILSETYYAPDERISVEITREDFQKILSTAKPGEPEPAFPHQIKIRSSKALAGGNGFNETLFTFKDIDFTPHFSESDFSFEVPQNTRQIVLEDNFN